MNIQKYKFICSNTDELWKKELRTILKRDIHEKGLGCCVKNTHIKIGNVHLGDFFEAQFLFGNAYWISIFSNALKNQFEELNYDKDERVLIVGYETYIEPVLLQLVELLRNNGYKVNSCIYEESKYILKNQKSTIRLRTENTDNVKNYEHFFIVCGISSTLNTYRQIISEIATVKDLKLNRLIEVSKCCSIIQVLPYELENDIEYCLNDDDLENIKLISNKDNTLSLIFGKQNFEQINANYLVDIFCEWQLAKNCKWCFDENQERPIITTNEASVIPIQMIGNINYAADSCNESNKISKINFFQKDRNNKFLYCDYLYYNHIERDSHHFQYYIRTNSLIKAIINDENEKLDLFCEQVSDILFENQNQNRIDVIIVPIHYSNAHFLNVIAKRVFKNSVEIIAFDPQKEYRSNFETKYSNYAYVIEASKSKTNIHFHFVDDQIITGNTFYHAKSFAKSLVRSALTESNENDIACKVKVFDSIIVMLDRNSNSTKLNYINRIDNFFSLIDISIPSMRNHGDSCYLCLKSINAESIKKNSALYGMSKQWEEKENYHTVKTLQEAKTCFFVEAELKERKFRRFYCENLLWENLKNDWSLDKNLYFKIVNLVASEIANLKKAEQYEYMISFIKVMSKPYLYYRENIKKAVHAIMLYIMFILNINYNVNPSTMLRILKKVPYGVHKDVYEKITESLVKLSERCINNKYYKGKNYLYVMVLSRLCAINSNHLLKYRNIEHALMFYDEISKKFTPCEKEKIKPMSIHVASLIKLVTNGISGKFKAKELDSELKKAQIAPQYLSIIQNIYLENLEADNVKSEEEKEDLFSDGVSTRQKYINVLKRLVPKSSAWFMIKQDQSSNWFPLAENIINGEKRTSIFEDAILDSGEDICFTTKLVGIKCYQSESANDIVYLILQNPNNPNDPNKLDFNSLNFIRSILKFRYTLYEKLEEDIHSGAIKELYQDGKWLDMFAQPKAVSHGQSEDIEKHLKNIEYKFLLYQSYKDKIEPKYYDIDSDLTLFSNLLISFLYSKKIANDRKLSYKFSELLEITKVSQISALTTIDKKNDTLLDFDDYSKLLKNENICDLFFERFDYYLDCVRKQGVKIELINDEMKKFEEIISFQYPHENSIWFSIAIIHILVKNAIRHGDITENISIRIKRADDGFDLIVKNKKLNKHFQSGKGITKEALSHAFKNKSSTIIFNDSEATKKTINEYTVKITNFFDGGLK